MRLILEFAVPVFLGYLFQQFYNLADIFIVGKCLGVSALASVGSTGAVCFLIIGGCMGICNGFAIPVSQMFGAGDYSEMRKFISGGIKLTVCAAAVVTAVTVVSCRPLLVLMKTPDDIFSGSYGYLVIILAGIPASLAYNLLAAVIRSVGDSRTPLVFLVVSSVLNIALDLFFILALGLGVEGAALATVVSQSVSSIACLLFILKNYPVLHLSREDWKTSARHLYILLSMGIPMGLQYSITAVGSVLLQSAVNALGSAAVASVSAASKISIFFCCPFDAMGTTMATYAGQNTGAHRFSRLNPGLFSCGLLGLVYSAAAFMVMLVFGRRLGMILVDAGKTEILANVYKFLVANSAFYFPLALVNIVRFMIQGMGFTRLALFAGLFELAGRGMFGLFFVPLFGYTAACFASPSAWILADCFLIPAYFFCRKRLESSSFKS
ncbi:MATE family efflux transporter [Treponema sp.]|uniref:MATE family efflux transporter n=1 Tax=Treponema sp. TaxID=166 RepID=UPI003EFF1327